MTGKINLIGKTFGDLRVIRAAPAIRGKTYWLCQCECGQQATIGASNLQSNHTKSCGCRRAPYQGRRRASPMYSIWGGIISRCTSPGTSRYPYYGGRGIKVCDRWLVFENFLEDMGERPPRAQIERIDNNGHYEPANCRWATRIEQARNKRTNRVLVLDGKRVTLAEAAELSGLRAGTIRKRLELGWTDERAVRAPLHALREACVPLRGSVVA